MCIPGSRSAFLHRSGLQSDTGSLDADRERVISSSIYRSTPREGSALLCGETISDRSEKVVGPWRPPLRLSWTERGGETRVSLGERLMEPASLSHCGLIDGDLPVLGFIYSYVIWVCGNG